ncbi:hypothetical protein AX16_010162 [Volvariella volvacea WC 439]|nr:hypothetical protein AX16_010162 [Volvariella volvacea WC 439]
MGGWKNRIPYLSYYLLTDNGWKRSTIQLGLSDIAYHSTIAGQRHLLFAGDHDRVKSYTRADDSGNFEVALPTHTLHSSGYKGPMPVVNDQLLRAGTDDIGVWKLDDLPTHGPNEKQIIEEPFNVKKLESWRDDPGNIEISSGSGVTNTLRLSETGFIVDQWKPHPTTPTSMICSASPEDLAVSQKYFCRILDLTTGTFGMRFIGHAHTIDSFATSPRDGNIFATACSDAGDGRLRESTCTGIALAHPDGIPLLFTGADKCEQIKVWDMRARSILYDLGQETTPSPPSPGTRKKTHYVRQPIAITSHATENEPEDDGEDEEEHDSDTSMQLADEDSMEIVGNEDKDYEDTDSEGLEPDANTFENDYEDPDWPETRWPKHALNGPGHYAHCYDAARHMLYRYVFKPEP